MNPMTDTPLHERRPVGIRPISARGLLAMRGDRRATHRTAYANYAYITRQAGCDALGTLDYRHRGDLVASGLELPPKHPRWAEEPGLVWREVDEAVRTLSPDAVRGWHIVLTLPEELAQEDWIDMVRGYARETLVRRGPVVDWAIHAGQRQGHDRTIRPHAHLLMTTRGWKHGAGHGESVANWHGPSIRAAIHADWLRRLPEPMRRTAASPFRYGAYVPAHPDCSRIAALFAALP